MEKVELVERVLRSVLAQEDCEKDVSWATASIRKELLSDEDIDESTTSREKGEEEKEEEAWEWEQYPRSQYAEVCTPAAAEKLYKLSPRVFYWMAASGTPITELVRVGGGGGGGGESEDDSGAAAALEAEICAGPGTTKPPKRPFVREIAKELCAWAAAKTFPKVFVPMKLLNETQRPDFGSVTPLVCKFVTCNSDDDGVQRGFAAEALRALGIEGVRALLGLRTTAGSRMDVFPPGISELIHAFRRRNDLKAGAMLSVGGRALTKHCKRSKDGWWGNGLVGSDREKNEKAEAALRKVLAGACWLNIHFLPHDIAVYEIRHAEGYGARWECKPPYNFRGFLEPQMENGHEQGWIH